MSMVVINPGSGPVDGPTSFANAEANMDLFVIDLVSGGHATVASIADYDVSEIEGRFVFTILADGQVREVEMPGLPSDQVRYTGAADQNIWNFPRLYVDGSSWVWKFALASFVRDDEE